MNKMIVWTVFLASSCLFAESSENLSEQVENKQETVAPKVEAPAPARVKKAPKTKPLTVQAPVAAPQIKEEVVVAETPNLEQEALVVDVLKDPTPQTVQVEAIKTPDQAPASIAMEEPAKEEAAALQIAEPAAEVAPVTAQMSATEAAPVLQIEATEPAEVEPAVMQPAQTTMDKSESQSTSMSPKKEEKLGSSRFANIAIGTASAAVVIVAAILGSN